MDHGVLPALTGGCATGCGGGTTFQNTQSVSSHELIEAITIGPDRVVFSISGGTGDADLHVKAGARPTTQTFDCRPFLDGNIETCTFNNPAAGDCFVMIRGFAAYSGVTRVGHFP